MATLNINNTDDPFYRYKMPALAVRKQTNCVVIDNLTTVSKSLQRPAKMILKYFGMKLGTHVSVDKAAVNGTFSPSELQIALQEFIDQYVLCTDCGNPETQITLKKKKYSMSCKACGCINQMEESKLLKHL